MIHKIGLCVIENNRILLCRKNRDTALLIVPGGRLEPGESPHECLHREVEEELGPDVRDEIGEFLGSYSDLAAGAEHTTVQVDLYRGTLIGKPVASSEIAELIWFGADDDLTQLSRTLRHKILPDLTRRGLL